MRRSSPRRRPGRRPPPSSREEQAQDRPSHASPGPAPASAWLTVAHPARPGFGMVSSRAAPGAPAAEEEREPPAAGMPNAPAPAPTVTTDDAGVQAPPVPADAAPAPLAPITGTADPVELEAYANGAGASLQLRGVTRASFRSSFRTENTATTAATGCTSCPPGQCVHATGTLVADYGVTTSVSLPSVPTDLPECQQARVRTAIDTVLAPHEQAHVRAFETFRGTTSRPFDLTVCRSAITPEVRALFEAERSARQRAAQAASDALDPFHVDVDLDCEDRTSQAEPAPGPGTDDAPDEEDEA